MPGAVTRWGILSTARINDSFLAGARLVDGAEVVAVASRDGERAAAYARERGIERSYGAYDDLLADPDIDAVYISLPNSLHVEWSIRALEAGKHVLCEKPLSRRAAEADRVFAAAERFDRFLMEAFMYRHHPQTGKLGELVENDAIGELRLVRCAFSFSLEKLADVRMRPELDGGALMDVGCYCVHASRYLAGEPESVAGEQVIGSTGVDVRFAATMRFGGDVVGHFDCGFDLPRRAAVEAVGSDGTLLVRDPWLIGTAGIELCRGGKLEHIEVENPDRFQLEIENMGAAIAGRASPLLGREDAIGQARTLEALYRAAATGERTLV